MDKTDSLTTSGGRPITFTASESTVWPDLTKGVIGSVADLLGDGFCIWASWTKDPLDKVGYGEAYYSNGKNGVVFGDEGTIVTATDMDGDGEFIQAKDAWTYAPKTEWYRGYYAFAAAIPASSFSSSTISGSHYNYGDSSTEFTYTDGVMNGITYRNRLTLDFPDNLFILGGNSVKGTRLPDSSQPDLMYAFSEVDNSQNDAGDVALDFQHTCSRLSISIAVNDPSRTMSIQKITIYGLLNSIPTPLVFSKITSINNIGTDAPGQTVTSTDNFSLRLSEAAASPEEYRSTLSSPFAVFSRPEGDSEDAARWDVKGSDTENPTAVRLVEDLIVFPGALSMENQLKLKIDYISGADQLTTFIKVSNGEWLPGKNYAYTFQADYTS